MIAIDGELAVIDFDRFDLPAYDLFLRVKALPESRVTYDWREDRYQVTTPARFADRLGLGQDLVPASGVMEIAPHLFDYQRWALGMALGAKRYALWLDTGLGKTAVYLEWARQVHERTGGRVLILAPLAVLPQIAAEAERFYGRKSGAGVSLPPVVHLRTRDELIRWCASGAAVYTSRIALCNYEKFIAGEIPELRLLAGLVADESSILKTGGGTIKWNLIKSARGIEYKLSCTATPAPNDAMEYASQAGFLEVLRTEGEILWTYFTKTKKNEWVVKPHAKAAFYRFMSAWSLYLRNPVTFGFHDILADLPDPEIIEERIALTEPQRMAMTAILAEHNAGMFGDQLGVTARTKLAQIARGFLYRGDGKERVTEHIPSRKVQHVSDLMRQEIDAGRQVLVWTTFDEEGRKLHGMNPNRSGILDGSQSDEQRQEILERFRAGELRCLISKPSLIGYGLNLQFVQSMIFSGFDDSFERMYQAIRRAYRLGQRHAVRVFVPYVPELEGLMFDNVRQKEGRFLAEVAAQEQLYRAALAEQLEAA